MDKVGEIKENIRKEMKLKRKKYPPHLREVSSARISEYLFEAEEFKKAKCVCVYMSAFGEVETKVIISRCFKMGKKVSAPITDIASNTISVSYVGTLFEKGAYGIYEPRGEEACDFREIDLVLVPGICFDRNGARIGFGKGYYDRFLKDTDAYKIGLCYEFQIIDEICVSNHDIKMDAIISESGILKFQK